MLTMHMC